MKKIIYVLVAAVLASCATEEKKAEYTVLSANLKNSVAQKAVLRGHDFSKEIPIPVGGVFTDTVAVPTDGYYELFINRERATVYLEQGKNLHVELDAMEFDETLSFTGDLSAENNYLAAKYLYDEQNANFEDIFGSDEATFSQKLQSLNQGLQDVLKNASITNETFVANEEKELEYTHIANMEMYPEYHKYLTKNSDFSVSPGFYDALKGIDYSDTTAFRNSTAYRHMLSTHFGRLASQDTTTNSTITYLKLADSSLPDGYAKDQVMQETLRYGLKADETLDEAYTLYKDSNPDPKSLAEITKRYEMLSTITKGKPSPTFNYQNFKGGTTSLEDLKGKFVYIDVWATWCGPCIREIPFLKQMEADYHNKNIEFVSISIDEERDHEKWKKMIPEKELGGIQLLADSAWKSKFVTDYGINGIPRFILIDPQGNIVSSDAPRPSDPELRTLLDTLI